MDKLPPLTALKVFEAVARTGSLTAAARELSVTHSAVSHQVRRLEYDLGITLLGRRGRGVAPTAAGERLARGLGDGFREISRAVAAVRPGGQGREITVSCLGTFLLHWLIPRIYLFKAAWPGVQLKLVEDVGPLDAPAVPYDVAIRVGRPPWPRGIDVTVLERETVGPVLSRDLADSLAIRSFADLGDAPLVHTRTRPTAWADWAAAAGAAPPEGGSVTWFDHYYFLLEGVRGGLGLGVAPEQLIRGELARGNIVAPFGFVPSGNDYVMAAAEDAGDPAVLAFKSWLLGEFRGGEPSA